MACAACAYDGGTGEGRNWSLLLYGLVISTMGISPWNQIEDFQICVIRFYALLCSFERCNDEEFCVHELQIFFFLIQYNTGDTVPL